MEKCQPGRMDEISGNKSWGDNHPSSPTSSDDLQYYQLLACLAILTGHVDSFLSL